MEKVAQFKDIIVSYNWWKVSALGCYPWNCGNYIHAHIEYVVSSQCWTKYTGI